MSILLRRRQGLGGAANEDRLEVLARAPAGAAVDVPLEPVVQAQAGAPQDLRIEVAAVVDDDAHRGLGRQVLSCVREHGGDAVDVGLDRLPADTPCRPSELALPALVQAEQLVGVAVLLVVVDQARIRRRGDDAVERATEIELARVAVPHRRVRVRSLAAANVSSRSSVSSV